MYVHDVNDVQYFVQYVQTGRPPIDPLLQFPLAKFSDLDYGPSLFWTNSNPVGWLLFFFFIMSCLPPRVQAPYVRFQHSSHGMGLGWAGRPTDSSRSGFEHAWATCVFLFSFEAVSFFAVQPSNLAARYQVQNKYLSRPRDTLSRSSERKGKPRCNKPLASQKVKSWVRSSRGLSMTSNSKAVEHSGIV